MLVASYGFGHVVARLLVEVGAHARADVAPAPGIVVVMESLHIADTSSGRENLKVCAHADCIRPCVQFSLCPCVVCVSTMAVISGSGLGYFYCPRISPGS